MTQAITADPQIAALLQARGLVAEVLADSLGKRSCTDWSGRIMACPRPDRTTAPAGPWLKTRDYNLLALPRLTEALGATRSTRPARSAGDVARPPLSLSDSA